MKDVEEEVDKVVSGRSYGSWHFFTIIVVLAVVVIGGYLCVHNRKKVRYCTPRSTCNSMTTLIGDWIYAVHVNLVCLIEPLAHRIGFNYKITNTKIFLEACKIRMQSCITQYAHAYTCMYKHNYKICILHSKHETQRFFHAIKSSPTVHATLYTGYYVRSHVHLLVYTSASTCIYICIRPVHVHYTLIYLCISSTNVAFLPCPSQLRESMGSYMSDTKRRRKRTREYKPLIGGQT